MGNPEDGLRANEDVTQHLVLLRLVERTKTRTRIRIRIRLRTRIRVRTRNGSGL